VTYLVEVEVEVMVVVPVGPSGLPTGVAVLSLEGLLMVTMMVLYMVEVEVLTTSVVTGWAVEPTPTV
jgi:hypothetical protein